MKKITFLLAVIIFTGLMTNSFAQKDRSLSKGFSINLITGIPLPSSNYGFKEASGSDDYYGILMGLQIGSRWYFSPGEKFGVGLMVNWFDITASYKSNASQNWNVVVADVSVLEVGPVGTFKLADNLAIDAYYNLRPTGLAIIFGNDEFDEDNTSSWAGGGITHAVGTAFRWKVLSFGVEYVLGTVKCSNTDTEYDYDDLKFMNNNLRIKLGVKF